MIPEGQETALFFSLRSNLSACEETSLFFSLAMCVQLALAACQSAYICVRGCMHIYPLFSFTTHPPFPHVYVGLSDVCLPVTLCVHACVCVCVWVGVGGGVCGCGCGCVCVYMCVCVSMHA
jgi:hypothetical protein